MPEPLTIASLAEAYRRGARVAEVVEGVLDRIAASPDPAVWISRRTRDDLAREVEALEARRPESPPLFGVPFAVKDNIDCAGLETTAACPPFAYAPAEDATVVARLRAAGALPIGKTNLDQFATGLVGVRSPYGAPRCVFDADYVSGGSSSGSAVAVARGQVAFALGTDTAGSGRVPAAFNHVVGVKPTRGLLSTSGVVPACRTLDCVSVFAASCAEGDLVRRLAQGFDPRDPYSRRAPRRTLPLEGLAVGVLRDADRDFAGDQDAAALYARATAVAADLGWSVREFDYEPFRAAAQLLYGGPWIAERLAALEAALERHAAAFDPAVREIVKGAKPWTAVDAFRGAYELAALRREAEAAFVGVDALLLPTAPTILRVDEVRADPIRRNARLGTYTNFMNLLDLCGVAVPAGFTPRGLPFGVTLAAPAFCDGDLAAAADRLHRALEPTFGAARAPLPEARLAPERDPEAVRLAVVGAHRLGQPLNHQLTERGAALLARASTAPGYRLFALPGTSPPKPGLVLDPEFVGPGIEVEVWQLSREAFGAFVAEVPPPLAIGTIALAGGESVKGFLCESAATRGATEITQHRSWLAYLAAARAS